MFPPKHLRPRIDRQLGLITRKQALGLGLAEDTVDSWVRRGQLEVVHVGVYRVAGSATTPEQRLLAAVLRAGGEARLSGWSACALYGLEGMTFDQAPWVLIPPERRVQVDGLIIQRSPLGRGEAATVRGLPAVTPMRALHDAAIHVQGKPLRVAIDDARRRGLIDLDRLLQRADELGKHRGAVAIRRHFGSGLLDQDGELERQFALALDTIGLRPAWGMEVLPGIITDACFPEASYVLECDGRHWHSIAADIASDLTTEGILRADGWAIDRVRAADLRNGRQQLLSRIQTTRAQRIAAGLGRPDDWSPVHPGRRIRPARAC
jgi:hypothetical protein